jgi:hypothetical protein
MAPFPHSPSTALALCPSDFRPESVTDAMPATSLIPKVDLPRYFTVTSMGLGPNQVAVRVNAEFAEDNHFNKAETFNKTNLVLDDFIDLFQVDRSKVPKLARFFLVTIALPRDFELAASRVEGHKNKVELSFELRGEKEKRWSKMFDTSNLNLADLAVLLDWAKEAKKHQR